MATRRPVALANEIPAEISTRVSPEEVPARPLEPETFRTQLGTWYHDHARRLPWRGQHDPYAVWLSEIMLQQTRVATVIDRYQAFLEKFPTLESLAEADEAEVLALWSGLGYYRRARLLHRAAQFVMRELRGKLPRKSQSLRTLPGVGDYTAAAIASIAFGESVAVVDGNVERVVLRLLGADDDGTATSRNLVRDTAKNLVPPASIGRSRSNPPGNHNQAMMELGATICLPRQPLCLQCPVLDFCRTRGEHGTPKRKPQKSHVVAHLLALRKNGVSTEVLLERRAAEASLMPRMLELPPLPLDAVEGREPVLRLRHAITNTNYYVQIFTEGVTGTSQPVAEDDIFEEDSEESSIVDLDKYGVEEAPFVGDAADTLGKHPLMHAVPATEADLRWMPTMRLNELPLTGLARKVLQRLGLMRLPTVRLR
ncbi:MAG TPA: A/G-specific adenine glycosylase [Acidobacteriaceae bacterium]